MNKKFAFLLSFLLLGFTSCNTPDKTANPYEGKIIFSLGKVTINEQAFKPGMSVKYGDTIKTEAASRLDIQLADKNIFRVSANSEVVFKISDKESSMEVKEGWLAGVIKNKAALAKKQLSILTPTMIAGIRGTSFCMKVEDPKNTYFCTCNGTIALRDSTDGSAEELVTASHHAGERFTLGEDGKITADKNAGMLYHDDKSVEELAKKIDVKIDWEKAAE